MPEVMKVKSKINKFISRLKIKIRILINKCPRQLRIFGKPLLGGLIGGLIGSIPGFFIGLVLGYFLGELFNQTFGDRKIVDYLENPGPQQLNESEPGMAAWCALGVLVASKNHTESSAENEPSAFPIDEKILKRVFLEACSVFSGPFTDVSQIEHFSRLAWKNISLLNPDLLSESFTYKRYAQSDAAHLARNLSRLAETERARILAREIILVIDPSNSSDDQSGFMAPKDPWKILGLLPGASLKEIKAHYRHLAKQFHPDNLEVLDEKQRDTASRAFMAIKDAYNQVTGEFKP